MAATVLAPTTLAAAQAPPKLPVPALPVGPSAPFASYQSEIYIGGMGAGTRPPFTTNLTDLEAVAGKVLPEAARRHLLASAGGAAAARANAQALAAWRIVPRMFIDRDERGLGTTVLGVAMPAPIILGPVGKQALAHGDGEAGSARAASALGLTYVHAPDASAPGEAIAAAAPAGSRWCAFDWPD